MAPIPRIADFPMACPACDAAAGFPFRATTLHERSGIEVSVRCHACRHEWTAVMEPVHDRQRRPQRVVHRLAS